MTELRISSHRGRPSRGRRARRRVLIEAGVSGTRAALAGRVRGQAVLERVAESDKADPHAAATDALERLASGGRLPREVLLLTAQAVAGVIELPVPANQPRPAAQMQEMVRWELEPLLAEHVAAHPLGSILVGRGAMTRQQAAEVADQVGRPAPGGTPGAPAARSVQRFGEVAVAMGYCTRQTRDESMGIQQWLQSGQDEYACGWRAIDDAPTSEGAHRWLGCAISREARDKWRQVLHEAGHELTGIHSLYGAATPCPLANRPQDEMRLLELDPDHHVYVHSRGETLIALQVGYDVEAMELANRLADWLADAPGAQLLLCGKHANLEQVAGQLGEVLGMTVRVGQPATSQDDGGPGEATAAEARMLGAWTDAGRRRPVLPVIRAADPGPAAYRRPAVWWAAAAALLIAAPISAELYHRHRLGDAEQRLAAVESQQQQLQQAIDQVEAHNQQVATLDDRLASLQQRLEGVGRYAAMLDEQLDHWQRRPGAVLQRLARHAPPGLVVDSVRHRAEGRLSVTGWAMAPTDAEQFAAALGQALQPWRMRLDDQRVQRRSGRLDLTGYQYELQFAPDAAAPADPLTEFAEGRP